MFKFYELTHITLGNRTLKMLGHSSMKENSQLFKGNSLTTYFETFYIFSIDQRNKFRFERWISYTCCLFTYILLFSGNDEYEFIYKPLICYHFAHDASLHFSIWLGEADQNFKSYIGAMHVMGLMKENCSSKMLFIETCPRLH